MNDDDSFTARDGLEISLKLAQTRKQYAFFFFNSINTSDNTCSYRLIFVPIGIVVYHQLNYK